MHLIIIHHYLTHTYRYMERRQFNEPYRLGVGNPGDPRRPLTKLDGLAGALTDS